MLPNSPPKREYDGDDDWAVFKIMRDEQREKRERRRQGLAAEIDALVAAGRARRLTEFHVRIDGVLDYFPSTGKFHDLRNNTRGTSDPTKGIPYKRLSLKPFSHDPAQ